MVSVWTEIIIKTPVGVIEQAEAALHMATPLGLYIEDYSDLESGLQFNKSIDLIEDDLLRKDRKTALFHIYFPPHQYPVECAATVREHLFQAGFSESSEALDAAIFTITSINNIAEEDWANNWKQYFKPLRVGNGILIVPEWEELDICDSKLFDGVNVIIKIDPGMAFGTGGHVTTKLCLELLEKHIKKSPAPISVLDVGCGSGILSIAAVLLGAQTALGIDIDEYAVRNARMNAANNGVADRARYQTGNLLYGIQGHYDIIIANIVASVVIELFSVAGQHLSQGGSMIVSGIINEREVDVMAAANVNGYFVDNILRSEGWVALLLRKTFAN